MSVVLYCIALLNVGCQLRCWHMQAVAPRLSWHAGDFFAPPEQLPDGDLVVLSRILHDWEEARCLKLLRTVHDKLPVGE